MDLYCDWNGDLIITPNGSIQAATGWDQVRQRIIRRLITNPAQVVKGTIETQADYIFHPEFGFGLGALVAGDYSRDFVEQLKKRISQAVFADEDVDSTIPPTITFQVSQQNALWIKIGVTLVTGQPGTISLQVG